MIAKVRLLLERRRARRVAYRRWRQWELEASPLWRPYARLADNAAAAIARGLEEHQDEARRDAERLARSIARHG